jgi:hypothetical protein
MRDLMSMAFTTEMTPREAALAQQRAHQQMLAVRDWRYRFVTCRLHVGLFTDASAFISAADAHHRVAARSRHTAHAVS